MRVRALSFLSAFALLPCAVSPLVAQEPPTWDQLDAHPVPQWFQDAKFGVFIHWGVYSVPAFCDTSTYSEWYQHWLDTNSHGGLVREFHERVYGKDTPYRAFAQQFQAELWDPAAWASIFRRAGARYIVITSKHHDGFCLWPDGHASTVRGYPWNAPETGPRRDLLGELAAAVRKEGVRFGLYYSFLEWHNPVFEKSIPDYVRQQMRPQIESLIERYEPAVFWPDGEWEHPDSTWQSREVLAWIRAHAKNADEIVVNDRWGKGARGEHGDFYTTEYGGYGGSKTFLGQKPFEECRGIGHSFAWNRAEGYDIYLSRTECVRTLIDLVSRGGNLLLDIGPAADGTIPVIMVDRLLAMGRWLDQNGAAIYGCRRSPFRSTPWGRATRNGDVVYLHVYDWPAAGVLAVPGLANDPRKVWQLGDAEKRPVPWTRSKQGVLQLDLQGRLPAEHATVLAVQVDGDVRVDERFVGDADGIVALPASAAAITGTSLRVEGQGNLGYWMNTTDTARWEHVAVEAGGLYQVELELAIAPGEEGGELALDVGGDAVVVPLRTATKGWQDYRVDNVSVFAARDRTEIAIAARAQKIGKTALCNLRRVRLLPMDTSKTVKMPRAMADALQHAAIDRACAAMTEHLRSKDGKAVAAFYLDDAVLHGIGEAPVTGREAIDAYWTRLAGVATDWRLETLSLRFGDGVAHQLGRSTLQTVWQGKPSTSIVEFSLVWKLTPDGPRIASDTWWSPR